MFGFAASRGGVVFREGVGDVLEEHQAENDDALMLGRVHVVVGSLPEAPRP